MKIVSQPTLSEHQKQAVLALWNAEYPEKLSYKSLADFDKYLSNLESATHFLLATDENSIVGWTVSFVREHETWFGLIIASHLHGKGYGTQLLEALKSQNNSLQGWVIDHSNDVKLSGETYRSPLGFYLKNNFVNCPEIRLEIDIMSAVKIQWVKNT